MRRYNLSFMKSAIANIAVLIVFAVPVALSVSWFKGIINSRDYRKLYETSEISSDCPVVDLDIYDSPVLSVTFDDGWETIYSNALPVLEEWCIDTTQYILADHYHDRQYLSKKQVDSLKQFGHEIASHSVSHRDLKKLSDSDIFWELNQAHILLNERYGSVNHFASPLGSYDDRVIKHAKSIYKTHRNTDADLSKVGDEDINFISNLNMYNLVAFSVRVGTTKEQIRDAIKYTQDRRGWLILVYHQVDYSGSEYSVSPEAFVEQMSVVHESKIAISTIGWVVNGVANHER